MKKEAVSFEGKKLDLTGLENTICGGGCYKWAMWWQAVVELVVVG